MTQQVLAARFGDARLDIRPVDVRAVGNRRGEREHQFVVDRHGAPTRGYPKSTYTRTADPVFALPAAEPCTDRAAAALLVGHLVGDAQGQEHDMSTCQRCGRRKSASDPIWCARCRRWFRLFVNTTIERLHAPANGSTMGVCLTGAFFSRLV